MGSGDEQRFVRTRRRHRDLPDPLHERIRNGQLHLLHGSLLQRPVLSGQSHFQLGLKV